MSRMSYSYFEYFKEMMACASQSALMLQTILHDYHPDQLPEYKDRMHEIEHAADVKKHEMMKCLLKEFLPPIDREDIMSISHLLDNICDSIEEVVLLLYMNNIQKCRPDIYEISEIIVRQCDELSVLLDRFSNYKREKTLQENIIKVNTLEENADVLYFEAVRRMELDGTELRQVVYWRDIYRCLEDCCDSCERVADAVEEVLMKLS